VINYGVYSRINTKKRLQNKLDIYYLKPYSDNVEWSKSEAKKEAIFHMNRYYKFFMGEYHGRPVHKVKDFYNYKIVID